MALDAQGRHPATGHFAVLFEYEHLPEPLRSVSELAAVLAQSMVDTLPDGAELSAGLRKLLEAKDCFVRAAVLALRAEAHALADQALSSATAVPEES